MALTRTREFLCHFNFTKGYLCGSFLASPVQKRTLIANHGFFIFAYRSVARFRVLNILQHQHLILQHFSASTLPGRICWEGSTHDVLLRKLESNLKGHQVDEAWITFNDFKCLYGFPLDSVVSRLITELTYSSDPRWLTKACDLVLMISKEKPSLLHREISTKLSLSLARVQMPIPASTILRIMLERNIVPPMDVLSLIVSHMVNSEIGACLAFNILVQICDCFIRLGADKNHHAKGMKPDTMIFNLVLDACLRFKSYLKGQLIVELMAQTGVVADAHSIIMVAQIHEMNGQRDEIKKFKDHINRISAAHFCQYQQFYDSLLRMHFKFGDIDAAADLLLNVNGSIGSVTNHKIGKEAQKPFLVPIGSPNLRTSLKLQIAPEQLQKESILCVDQKGDLIISMNGRLLPSNRFLAKLIIGYKRQGRVSELSRLLISLQKVHTSGEENLISDLVNACIHLGWLDTAHDILDDMEISGVCICSATYTELLRSYCSKEMFKEAKALLRQMRKVGLLKDFSNEMDPSVHLPELVDNAASPIYNSNLTDILVQEIREEENNVPSMIHELNSSIYFFCKAKMMQDALKTYRRMKKMKIQMTEQTFAYLMWGYSSLDMHRDITILWGDIKSYMMSCNLVVSRDLYELLLLNFIRGGYFERVIEVIGYMKERNMYIDKAMYKNEYLKLHKNLYRRLKASEANTEAQRNRIQYVQTFKRWVGIDGS